MEPIVIGLENIKKKSSQNGSFKVISRSRNQTASSLKDLKHEGSGFLAESSYLVAF